MAASPTQPSQPDRSSSSTTANNNNKVQQTLDSIAARLHGTTNKHNLPLICAGGFLAEMLWHSQVEARVLKTQPPQVRRAMRRAGVFWPALFLGTSAALWWAEGRVSREE